MTPDRKLSPTIVVAEVDDYDNDLTTERAFCVVVIVGRLIIGVFYKSLFSHGKARDNC